MRDVGELVRQHSFELVTIQAPEQTRGHHDDRSVRRPSRGESIRRLAIGDPHTGLGHIRHGAQSVDNGVQLRSLLRGHFDGPHRLHGQGVREPPLPEQQCAAEPEDENRTEAEGIQGCCEHDVQQPEAEQGPEHAGRQTPVSAVSRARHSDRPLSSQPLVRTEL